MLLIFLGWKARACITDSPYLLNPGRSRPATAPGVRLHDDHYLGQYLGIPPLGPLGGWV